LACLGRAAETSVLAALCGQLEDELHASLSEAVRAGLVVRFGQDTLRATLKGLAYAGIDTRAPVNGSRGFAS